MKTSTEKISARLRVYGKNSTKISNDCQVLLEIRNFSDKPIRISAKNSDLSLMQLKPHQMKKGVCGGRSDANLINARLNKLKDRLMYVMQFLQYGNIKIDKPTIEDFLYRRWSEVFHFFSEITDGEDAAHLFTYLNQSKEAAQKEINEENKFLLSIGVYKAFGFMEALNLHNFENCRKETIIPNFTKWCKSIGMKDYLIENFNKNAFDSFTRFMIDQPKIRSKSDTKQYYSAKTIDNMVKEVRIFLKALKAIDYKIDSTAFDFKVIKGNRNNAHIQFLNDEKANVWSITVNELAQIRNSVQETKLPERLRKAATLFTIQTLLGGLRISELNKIKQDSFILANGMYYCYTTTKKTKKMLDSPVHPELVPILQGIDFDLSKLKFKTDIDYNAALKELAIKLEFNRDIVLLESKVNKDTQGVHKEKLFNLFTSKVARKAAVTILFSKGYTLEQIAKMTKHSLSAIQYYVAVLTDERSEMMGRL